jgi:dihydrofolate synthase/folylpolyglutamate synthase
MQLADWLAHQQAQHPATIELGLERVRDVAQRLGLMPWPIPSVIVGGTNGKGSTVAFLTALSRAAGLRVGTYTSPHLQRYNERVAIDALPVDDAALVRAFERIEAARAGTSLTFFEYGTLAAFLVFQEQGVDAAVIEVGLGGRLDATNIIDADVAVLCSVGLDHMDWLGPTVEDIGREKAGIFRAGRPVILGSPSLPVTVHETTRRLDCVVRTLGRDFHIESPHTPAVDGTRGSWRGWSQCFDSLPPPALAGPIQSRNAATAIAAFVEWLRVRPELTRRIPGGALSSALLGEALLEVQLRGRCQRVFPEGDAGPEWILDVAHNADSAGVLAAALAALPPARRTFAVVGILADKDASVIGERLADSLDDWVLCGLEGPRGSTAEALRHRLPERCRTVALAPDVSHGCAAARALAGAGDRIVVFGSFHVVGPALDWLGL